MDELVDFRLVTSTYVIHETIRRIIKGEYKGPVGKRKRDLALHFLKVWLVEHEVKVICIPANVFESVKKEFEEMKGINCDLTDISSMVISTGIQQRMIISPDNHFRQLGMVCLPD